MANVIFHSSSPTQGLNLGDIKQPRTVARPNIMQDFVICSYKIGPRVRFAGQKLVADPRKVATLVDDFPPLYELNPSIENGASWCGEASFSDACLAKARFPLTFVANMVIHAEKAGLFSQASLVTGGFTPRSKEEEFPTLL